MKIPKCVPLFKQLAVHVALIGSGTLIVAALALRLLKVVRQALV
jgi:hypothetical protein